MSAYSILIRGKAAKKIQRVPPQHLTLIEQHIDVLADNPRHPQRPRVLTIPRPLAGPST